MPSRCVSHQPYLRERYLPYWVPNLRPPLPKRTPSIRAPTAAASSVLTASKTRPRLGFGVTAMAAGKQWSGTQSGTNANGRQRPSAPPETAGGGYMTSPKTRATDQPHRKFSLPTIKSLKYLLIPMPNAALLPSMPSFTLVRLPSFD
jgi:hypothetical protein